MRRASFFGVFAIFGLFGAAAAACAADGEGGPVGPSYGKPDGAPTPTDDGGPPGDGGKEESDIVFEPGTTFAKRDCKLTVDFPTNANDVKLAGEFTSWANGARPMAKSGGKASITLEPGNGLESGKLYAYKIVADGNWVIDPGARYRKIVDGQMNSALTMPDCGAGPEVLAEKVNVSGGAMKVRVTTRSATDGDAPVKMIASFDRGKVTATSYAIDKGAGAIDFSFPSLGKGKHTLSLRSVDGKGRESLPIDLPSWVEDEAFDYRDGALYMFVIDRFANGNKANDKPVGVPVHYDADWHGGDLEGATKVLESGYFEKLGVRTIWLSPLNEQTSRAHPGDGNQTYSGYHGYWPVKSRSVEPRFGGDAALRAFVQKAHARGLRVLLDLINNQIHQDHEYRAAHPDWFRTACKCGDDGCGWSQRPFDCMFQPYLPDIDWTKAGAEKQFVADATHWISEYDLDGFRVDAVKHVESNSVYNMRAELTRRFEQGGARIFMVGETAVGENDSGSFFGETFTDGYDWIDAYTGKTALDGQFDFPTRHNMADGLVNGLKPLNEVEGELQKSLTRYRPGNYHVRFLNGHDNPRIASIAAQDPKLGCTWASGCRDNQLPPLAYDDPAVYVKLKRALTVLYTMPGVPYLYAGDEVAFGGGPDPDMRRNMLFGEGLDEVHMAKPGTQAPVLTAQQTELRAWVRKLGAARVGSKALRRGERKTLLGNEGDLWVYAWTAGGKDVAVVAINRGGAVNGRVIGGGGLAGPAWTSALGTGTLASSGADLTLSIGAGEAAIFVAK